MGTTEKISCKHYSGEFKYKVVKEALTTDNSISEVCKRHGIGTNIYYKWQEIFFSSALAGLSGEYGQENKVGSQKVLKLEQENLKLKTAVSELVSENIEFKKKFLV